MDKLKIEKLQSVGINVEEALDRFSGIEELYERFLKKFIDDPEFNKLETSMETSDFDSAFTACHTMKGVVGNLSIIPLYKIVFEETELLRNGTDIAGAISLFPALKEEYTKVINILLSLYQ